MSAERVRILAALLVAAGLPGCAGVRTSSPPVYPDDWPALVTSAECPDVSGTYRAVSDPAAPLVYPPGGHPRQMFMFVSYGEPESVPRLGRRVLPWHLAGVFPGKDDDAGAWDALAAFAARIETDATGSGTQTGGDWVEVRGPADDAIQVRAGIGDDTIVELSVRRGSAGFWTYNSHTYGCDEGGMMIASAFPPPDVENPNGRPSAAVGAWFTFYRAVDGSLVALEEAYTGVGGDNMVFKKWWRWRLK
jgi:hypothetical protein